MNAVCCVVLALVGQCGPNGCGTSRFSYLLQPFQCGPNGCSPSAVIPQASSLPDGWHPVAGHSEQFARFVAGKHVGSWDQERKIYQLHDAATDTWGAAFSGETMEAALAQSASPATSSAEKEPVSALIKTGVTRWDEIGQDGQQYRIGDKPSSKAEVYKTLDIAAPSDSVPRDGEKPFLALVTSDASARADFGKAWDSAEELRPWRDRTRLKLLDPNDPMLRDRDGQPLWYSQEEGFYYVAPGGKQLGKMSLKNYEGPAQLAGALFKIDPQFDPSLVPDLANPPVDPDSDESTNLWPFVFGFAGFLASICTVAACAAGLYVFYKENRNVVLAQS